MGRMYNKKTSFIEHLQPLTNYASKQQISLTELFTKSNVELKRKSDFQNGRKTFTAYYFIKLLGGLQMTAEQYEQKTKMRFTDEQREALKYQQFVEAEQDLFLKAMKNPHFLQQIRKLSETYD